MLFYPDTEFEKANMGEFGGGVSSATPAHKLHAGRAEEPCRGFEARHQIQSAIQHHDDLCWAGPPAGVVRGETRLSRLCRVRVLTRLGGLCAH